MSSISDQILAAFDALPPGEQRELVARLVRRAVGPAGEDMTNDALLQIADSLFLELDEAEGSYGQSQTR